MHCLKTNFCELIWSKSLNNGIWKALFETLLVLTLNLMKSVQDFIEIIKLRKYLIKQTHMKSCNFGYVQVLSAYCGCYKTNVIKQDLQLIID